MKEETHKPTHNHKPLISAEATHKPTHNHKPLISAEAKARLKSSTAKSAQKAKEFFAHIKKAFIELDKHVKEKAAERKAYRQGKKVKPKPQTEKRVQKAKEHLKLAEVVKQEVKQQETKHKEPKQHTERPRPKCGKPQGLRPIPTPTADKENANPLQYGQTHHDEIIEPLPILLPQPLITAQKKLVEYTDNPNTNEAKNGLNDVKDILNSFDKKENKGLFTLVAILAALFIISKL